MPIEADFLIEFLFSLSFDFYLLFKDLVNPVLLVKSKYYMYELVFYTYI